MLGKKYKTMLVLAGLGFVSGCAGDGLKMPLRDTFTSLGSFGHESALGSGGKEELSPEFRAAQKMFKKDPEGSLLAWARWQEDVGEFGEARKRYRELLVAYPDNVDAQLGLARIESSCGRVQQAEDILTTLASNRPENAPVRLELGRMYTQQENWAKAIASFEEASAVNPEDQVCRYELGVAFARSHRFDQALSHLTFAVGESAAHYNIGYIMHEQGNDVDAAEWFQNALQTHPDTRTAEMTRAMLAQITPDNSHKRQAMPTYPSADPSAEFLATRAKQNNVQQYEPRSFDAVAIRPGSGIRTESAEQVLPFVANSANPKPDVAGTLLPPVIKQPVRNGLAYTAGESTGSFSESNRFQTVSHSVPQESTAMSKSGKNQPPQWNGPGDQSNAARAALVPQQQSPTPAKWRGRQD